MKDNNNISIGDKVRLKYQFIELNKLYDINGDELSELTKSTLIDEQLINGYLVVEKIHKSEEGYLYLKLYGTDQLLSDTYFELFDLDTSEKANNEFNIEKRAIEILEEKDASKSIKDTDPLIGGAKKVKNAYKTISIEDLFRLGDNDVAIRDIITKDRVFPKINIEEERQRGTLSGATFAKIQLQKLFGNKPEINTSIGRKAYVLLLGTMKDVIYKCKTTAELKIGIKTTFDSFIYLLYNVIDTDLSSQIADEITLNKEKNLELVQTIENYEKLISSSTDINIKKEYRGLLNVLKSSPEYRSIDAISELEQTILSKITNITYYNRNRANKELLKHFLGEKALIKIEGIDFELCENYDGIGQEKAESNIEKIQLKIDGHTKTIIDGNKKISLYKRFINQYDNNFEGEKIDIYTIKDQLINAPSSGYSYFVNRAVKVPKSIKNHKNEYWSESDVNEYMNKYGLAIIDGHDVLKSVIERAIPNLESYLLELISINEKLKKSIEEQKSYINENWFWYDGKDTVTNKQEKKVNKINRTSIEGIPVLNSGTPLSFIKRIGGYKIEDDNFTTIDKYTHFYKKYLGMDRIQFGLSLKDNERIQYMKHFAGSLIDLFDILDMDIQFLNSIGNLGIQFASAGKGRAMAHYSSNSVSINLTKSKGDGTVAHEMAHYLDNLFANIGNNISNWRTDIYMSDIYGEKKSSRYIYQTYDNNVKFLGGNLNLYVTQWLKFIIEMKIDKSAILNDQAMGIIKKNNYINNSDPYSQSDWDKPTFDFIIVGRDIDNSVMATVMRQIKSVAKQMPDSEFTKLNFDENFEIKNIESSNDEFIQNCLSILCYGDSKYSGAFTKYNNDKGFKYPNSSLLNDKNVRFELETAIAIFGRKSFNFKVQTDKSRFYSWASAMDSGKSKKYWSSAVELFARSFETYILTKMDERGMINNFLISSDWFDSNAYPQGDERIIINSFFDKIFFEAKQLLKIPSFSIDINDRVDEYIDLSESSILPKNGITINDENGKIIELEGDSKSNLNKIEHKINELIKSLEI